MKVKRNLFLVSAAALLSTSTAFADTAHKSELGISNETGSSSGYSDKKDLPDNEMGKLPGEKPDSRGQLHSPDSTIRETAKSGEIRSRNAASDREAAKIAPSATDPRHDRDSDSGPYRGNDPQAGAK